MHRKQWLRTSWALPILLSLAAWGCSEPAPGPNSPLAPNYSQGREQRGTIVVNPNANGNGIARTVQEGVDRVAAGGKVLVKAGVYDEIVLVRKGLTLEGIGDGATPVVIEQVRTTLTGAGAVIQVLTSESVVLRGITIRHVNAVGIGARPLGGANLTLERMVVEGGWTLPPPITASGLVMSHNTVQSGGRSRLVVRDSRLSGVSAPMRLFGDVDVLIERNHFTARNPCMVVSPTGTGGGTVPAGAFTNVDILDNDFNDCGSDGPGLDGNGIRIEGTVGAATTGTVNIIGNRFSSPPRVAGDCNATAILYEFYSGRIEHNSFNGVVQDCAAPTARSLPAAIFVGSRTIGMPPATPVVRFNDIAGNAHAGLRIGANQPTSLDARCNYWGSADGPSGVGSGSGDAVVVEEGAATPAFMPFATGPIAGTTATGC